MVDRVDSDAVFIPVLPLIVQDYAANCPFTWSLENMAANTIISATAGSPPFTVLDVRYWIDPAFSAETAVVLWSVCNVRGNYTVNIYNDEEDRKSVNFPLQNEELNTMDPATLIGRPADFIDGFIRINVPPMVGFLPPRCDILTGEVNWMFVFSYVDSDLIGAMQTLLAGDMNSIVPWAPAPPCPGPCE